MAWFTVDTTYTDDRALLDRVRPAHREWLGAYAESGAVLGGGPWADGSGGFFIIAADDRAALDDLLAKDPYTLEGVAVRRVIREWTIVLGPWAGQ
ncbi:YciI family protein [Actinokineospora soli]|uniref:YciI family protein n=1 Tax=Actinokineospora soli TaxID=1048753 RepID=A0ABW2U017_9PSEU